MPRLKYCVPERARRALSERYLDMIVKGCEYYKVQPAYVNRLKEEQVVKP